MNVSSIETISTDGIEYLKSSKKKYDWVYVDPSRRHDLKGKVFFLIDCVPNIPEELNVIFERSNNLMIKTSPLLDISAGTNELNHVKTVHIVAVNNEVKELLWILEKDYDSEITIETINLKAESNETFKFKFSQESELEVNYKPTAKRICTNQMRRY